MSRKTILLICVAIGSSLGGFIPTLWGDGFLSFSSVICTALGGVGGIWLGLRLTR